MTEEDLYKLMLQLANQFEAYKNKKLPALNATEVSQMIQIYKGVQQVYPISGLPRHFNSSCPSCIISALEQFISIFERFKTKYVVVEKPKTITKKTRKKKDVK